MGYQQTHQINYSLLVFNPYWGIDNSDQTFPGWKPPLIRDFPTTWEIASGSPLYPISPWQPIVYILSIPILVSLFLLVQLPEKNNLSHHFWRPAILSVHSKPGPTWTTSGTTCLDLVLNIYPLTDVDGGCFEKEVVLSEDPPGDDSSFIFIYQ